MYYNTNENKLERKEEMVGRLTRHVDLFDDVSHITANHSSISSTNTFEYCMISVIVESRTVYTQRVTSECMNNGCKNAKCKKRTERKKKPQNTMNTKTWVWTR